MGKYICLFSRRFALQLLASNEIGSRKRMLSTPDSLSFIRLGFEAVGTKIEISVCRRRVGRCAKLITS